MNIQLITSLFIQIKTNIKTSTGFRLSVPGKNQNIQVGYTLFPAENTGLRGHYNNRHRSQLQKFGWPFVCFKCALLWKLGAVFSGAPSLYYFMLFTSNTFIQGLNPTRHCSHSWGSSRMNTVSQGLAPVSKAHHIRIHKTTSTTAWIPSQTVSKYK